MRNKAESKKSQSGQILMYTTIILMLAALILVPLMQFTFTSHRSATIRTQRTLELYASDAGIEDALYQIKTEQKGTALASLGFGNSSSYNPGTPGMNDRTENVTVQKVWLPEGLPGNATKNWSTPAPVNNDQNPSSDTDKSDKLVVVGMLQTVQATAGADDFDHGWPNGSSGGNWTGPWDATGSASLASGGASGSGLKFTDAAGNAMRQVILPKYMQPELKFDAKSSSFETGDSAYCSVSSDGGNWTPVATWSDGNETSNYKSFDIDLSQYGTGDETAPLWIRFDANLSVQAVASDNFSTGNWIGGSGWSGNWVPTGSASVVNTGSPHSSPNQAKLTSTGEVRRKVSLAGLDRPSLTFWAKTSSFGATDTASLRVSINGTTWTTKQTFTNSQAYATYSPYTIDLSQYQGNSTFWISFLGAMGTSGSAFASDGFESGWPNSGSGWAGSWATSSSGTGAAGLYTGSSYAHAGTHALQLSRSGSYSGSYSGTGSATRVVDISGQNSPRIQFYARSYSADGSDTLTLQVSHDGSNWFSSTAIGVSNSSYQSFTYNVFDIDPQAVGQSQVWIRFNANMTGSSSDTSDYFYIDDINILGTPCFYFDDVSINEGDSFSVDNVWIGFQANSNNIEIAYIDPNFDTTVGSPGINDPAYLDRIGVWMPTGCEYIGVVGNQTTPALSQRLPQQPDILPSTYAGGTILEWDFSPIAPNLGNSTTIELPIVWDLTFSYSMPPTQVMQGMFIWIKAHGAGGRTYLSWDKGYEIYKAVSKAHSQILGTNTQVAAYAAQGEVNKKDAASYGDYVATGGALLFDDDGDGVKDRAVNPSGDSTWVTYGGFFYDGRSEITSIPNDATVTAAWLYWSAFMNTSDWQSSGSKPDTTVSFMYPKRYGPETFAVYVGNATSRIYTVNAYAQSSEPYKESMDLLAHQPALTLSNMRYVGEVLGNATLGNSTPDSWLTLYRPILSSPAPSVKVRGNLTSQSGNYTINYDTGNVTIINPALYGQVTIDYSVSGAMTLSNGTDYTINQTSGNDIRYTGFTITNSQVIGGKLQGTVTIDYYYAKHWVAVQHAAYDKYGTVLAPVQTDVITPDYGYVGNTYACFADVTELLTGNGTYTDVIGDGQYAVGNVTATTGVSNTSYATRCFSGWSLIVLYKSESSTAHQFYLWDPIHNAADCPFMVRPVTDYSPQPEEIDVPFTLNDFYPPEGTVSGKTTYFVGEGDVTFPGDSIGFKGASQTSYTYLSGVNNPVDNVMNCLSTNGESGIDVDTYNVLGQVGNDTQANVNLQTDGDRWYLIYIILSFKTNVKPPPDYLFNVASITYQYELGGK